MYRLSHDDGTWQEIQDSWSKQCHEEGEDFESYMPVTFPFLGDQIDVLKGHSDSGIYGLKDEGDEPCAIMFVNGANIPGFTGKVLRIRNLIVAPKYDFGDYNEEEYAKLLASVFSGILDLAENQIVCENIKFHSRTAAEAQFFKRFGDELEKSKVFSQISFKGAWLIINK